ncbi:hypothetical protein [Paenibacillus gallinarum]|uniref:Uncharacterized protein n=1 Tax=Paenibacillus gallinarum TaxID=2762232 RepID=A0ABR8T3E9_9BACL|nr:hypothetical protein [Paenibacillus gallinarum]MBD7970306.1 hypothetical protein [Paenibacillus gallinarum]
MIEAPIASEVPAWLRECFEQTPKPDLLTTSFLSQWGPTLLDAKIEHRKYLDPILRGGPKPTKLAFDEIGATLMNLFSFKRMALPAKRDALGIRIEGQEGIWETTSKRIGEYLTDTQFIYNAMLLITPTHRKHDTSNVTRYIRIHAPEMILPIPPQDIQNECTMSNFWKNFEELYDWDMIPLELLYRTYRQWFINNQTKIQDNTPISPLLFKEKLRLLSSERWVISDRRQMNKI